MVRAHRKHFRVPVTYNFNFTGSVGLVMKSYRCNLLLRIMHFVSFEVFIAKITGKTIHKNQRLRSSSSEPGNKICVRLPTWCITFASSVLLISLMNIKAEILSIEIAEVDEPRYTTLQLHSDNN